MGRLAQTLGVTNKRLSTTTTAEAKAQTLTVANPSGAVQINSISLFARSVSRCEFIMFCRLIHYLFTSASKLQHDSGVSCQPGTLLCFVQDEKLQTTTCAASASNMFTLGPMKLVVGWRFAPACCAAQLVSRRGPRSTVQLCVHFGPLKHAVPVDKACALGQEN